MFIRWEEIVQRGNLGLTGGSRAYLQHLSILYLLFGARDEPDGLLPYECHGLEVKLGMKTKSIYPLRYKVVCLFYRKHINKVQMQTVI